MVVISTREGVSVVAMGGVTNIAGFLERFGPRGLDVAVAGLCDVGEEAHVRRALERAGLGAVPRRAEMEELGFYVCVADLEDELIRSLGVESVERVIAEQGELRALRTLQKQGAHQGRGTTAQLRRFMGSRSGRKARYARLLVDALGPEQVPRPLDRVPRSRLRSPM